MALTFTDAHGVVFDTGVSTKPTVRANVEIESHTNAEVDTGSKLTPVATVSTHIPHRDKNSQR